VIPATVGKDNAEANVFVDVCADNLRRVLIVERGKPPAAPGEGCDRKDVQGLYWIRRVSTVVVTMSDPTPRVLLRQGSFSFKAPRVFGPPTGLVVFGNGGLTKVSDIGLFACGDVTPCSHKGSGWSGMAGVEYWVKPWLSGEAAYLKPANATASGSGDTYRFDSVLKVDVFSVAAKIGIPVGRVRIYGKVGGDYHDGTFETDQTLDDRSVTVDDVPQMGLDLRRGPGSMDRAGGRVERRGGTRAAQGTGSRQGRWLTRRPRELHHARHSRSRLVVGERVPVLPSASRRGSAGLQASRRGSAGLQASRRLRYCTSSSSISNNKVAFGGIGPYRTDP
jgi:hypothetical protein